MDILQRVHTNGLEIVAHASGFWIIVALRASESKVGDPLIALHFSPIKQWLRNWYSSGYNEAMRVILGTTKDTPIETMCYLLDLPSMETRHKVEQVKAYLSAMQNPKNPLHDAVKEEKGCRLARGKSWMGQAEQSIQRVCSLTELKQVRDWEKRPVEFKPYYKTLLSENLGTHCREWPAEKTNAEVQMLVEANSKSHDIVIYTDGSVTRDRSGWGFTVKQDGRTVHEDSGAHRVTTSSLTMEVEAVTHAIQWLASQHDARITHAIILTDSMNLLQKVESGMGCPDWHTAMHSLQLQRLLWIYCPGHAGVSGNERADRLASTADITSGLQLGRAEDWGTFSARTSQSITALTAWRKEEWRKEAANIPPSKAENDLCSTRQILALFRGKPWGDC